MYGETVGFLYNVTCLLDIFAYLLQIFSDREPEAFVNNPVLLMLTVSFLS